MSYDNSVMVQEKASFGGVVDSQDGSFADTPEREMPTGSAVGSLPGRAPHRTSAPFVLPPLTELDVDYDADQGIIWQFMKPVGRPSFTHGLLRDMNAAADAYQAGFAAAAASSSKSPARFIVTGSRLSRIYNLGGDLGLFLRLIETRNRDALRTYARACAEGQHRLNTGFDLPVCMIALVQGDALGGGFEAALAHDVIIAERSAQFGLPEVLFNLFPGMGAYSFLARRIGPVRTEQMILSGRVYTAPELQEMGVVDKVVEDGHGTDGVYDFVHEFERIRHARHAVLRTRKIVSPVSRRELIQIADVWVDAAMSLEPGDLRRMSHLAKAQDRRWAKLAKF
jgi:DSF synthase